MRRLACLRAGARARRLRHAGAVARQHARHQRRSRAPTKPNFGTRWSASSANWRSPLIVRDPALNDYVRRCLQGHRRLLPRPARVHRGRAAVQRVMAPNGAMIVWTGALLRMRDEAQLALVLGHEFGHFRARIRCGSGAEGHRRVPEHLPGARLRRRHRRGDARRTRRLAPIIKFTRDKEREADASASPQWSPHGYDPKPASRCGTACCARRNPRRTASRGRSSPRTRRRGTPQRRAAAAAAFRSAERTRAAAFRAATRPTSTLARGRARATPFASSILVIPDLLDEAPAEDAAC